MAEDEGKVGKEEDTISQELNEEGIYYWVEAEGDKGRTDSWIRMLQESYTSRCNMGFDLIDIKHVWYAFIVKCIFDTVHAIHLTQFQKTKSQTVKRH